MATVATKSFGSKLGDNLLIGLIRRLVVRALLAPPFLRSGVFGLLPQSQGIEFLQGFQGVEGAEVATIPLWASCVMLVVGGCLMAIGLYLSLAGMAPSPPLVAGETESIMRHPIMKSADARIRVRKHLYLGAGYMAVATLVP